MFTTNFINDANLSNFKGSTKQYKVEIKVNTEWKDISNYVTSIEIVQSLQFNGNSQLNKAGVKLTNLNGEFSPSKLNTTYNPPTESGKPFLTTKFPIRISVITATKGYCIFRGYVNKVTERKLEVSFEAYDILFALTRYKLVKGGFSAINITPKEAVQNLLESWLPKWQADFSETTLLNFSYSFGSDLLIFSADGSQTYMATLNSLCSSIAAYFTYRAIDNTIYFSFDADEGYTEPSANVTLNMSHIKSYSIDTQIDQPNRVIVEADLLEPQESKISNYWTFDAGNDINKALLMPKGSFNYIDINFNAKGYNPSIDNVKFVLANYVVSMGSTGTIRTPSAPYSRNVNLTGDLPVELTKDVIIRNFEIKLDSIRLEMVNNSNQNIAIMKCSIDAYPFLELGNTKVMYEDVETLVNEISIKSGYFTKEAIERVATAYLKFVRSAFLLNLDLTGFYPELFEGAVVNATVYDTSLNNTKMLIRSVTHKIENGMYFTSVELGSIENLSGTVVDLAGSGAIRSTTLPVEEAEPVVSVIETD